MTGFWVQHFQLSLCTLQHLLTGLGQTFNACCLDSCAAVLLDQITCTFSQCSACCSLRGFLGEFFAGRAEQAPDTGEQFQGQRVQSGLRDSGQRGVAQLQCVRSAPFVELTRQVRTGELGGRGQTSSAQTCNRSGGARQRCCCNGSASSQRRCNIRKRLA